MSMTATAGRAHADPHHIGRVIEHPGPAPKRTVTAYGFWVFLLSDIVMFSCFFAAYAVLVGQTADGPKGSEIFEQRNVAIETVCLLLSSFTCGMAGIAADVRNRFWFYLGMAVTCVLGLIFLAIEFKEFADRLRLRVLCHDHGLCADLAHLVDGDFGRHRRLRDLRRVRLARP